MAMETFLTQGLTSSAFFRATLVLHKLIQLFSLGTALVMILARLTNTEFFAFSLMAKAGENEALTYNDGVVVKKVEMTVKLPTSMSKLFKKVK